MLMAAIVLALLVFTPAALVWTLRANGALAFLSLCAGYAVFNYSTDDINRLFGQLHTSVNASLVSLAVVLLPPIFTLLLTHHGIAKSKRLLHIAPALACGGLAALTAVPLLTDSVTGNFYSSSLWIDLTKYQSGIVGIGALLSFLLIWFDGNSRKKSKNSKSSSS